MPTVKARIEQIQKYLTCKIEEKNYALPKAPEPGKAGEQIDMKLPEVCAGSIPHSNFNLYGATERYFRAPYILVGFNEAEFADDSESVDILIQVCVYTLEAYKESSVGIPDNLGLLDALQVLEDIKEWIIEDAPFPVTKPFRMGTYDTMEITYPFAFGYLGFEVNTNEGKVNRKKFNYE